MTWNDMALNWTINLRALAQRFPYAETRDLARAKDVPDELTRVLAASHDLTEREVRAEIEDFLFVQSLARCTADFRVHDVA